MNRKRLRCLFLAVVMLFSMVVPVSAASGSLSNFKKQVEYSGFADVPANAWYAEGVKTVCEYGIMNGKSETTFEPNGTVTLAETLAIACRLHNIYRGGSGKFEATSPWYQVYVDYAAENDILSFLDEPDSAFWNSKVSNEIFVHLMANALPEKAYKDINNIEFGLLLGVSIYPFYAKQIYQFFNAGILTGLDSTGKYNSDANISRAEACTILSRIIKPELRVLNAVTPSDIVVWSNNVNANHDIEVVAGTTYDLVACLSSKSRTVPITWSVALLKPDVTYVSDIYHDADLPWNCWTATAVAATPDSSILYIEDKAGHVVEWNVDVLVNTSEFKTGALPEADKTTYKKTAEQLEIEKFWEELDQRLANIKADGSVTDPATPTVTTSTTTVPTCNYIINTNTGKFHYTWCSSVKKMSESNKWYYTGTRDNVIDMGYVPCKRCCP